MTRQIPPTTELTAWLTALADAHSDLDTDELLSIVGAAEADDQPEAAIAAYAALLTRFPSEGRVWCNLGNSFWLADRPVEALRAFRQAALLLPESAIIQRGLGNCYKELDNPWASHRSFERSWQLDPSQASTAWNWSNVMLGLEDYARAYSLGEVRLQIPALCPWRSDLTWQGQSTERLLIWSEQGYGDTLQYLRWLTLLPGRVRSLHLVVEAPLKRLCQEALRYLSLELNVWSKEEHPPLPQFDYGCSLLSLPACLPLKRPADFSIPYIQLTNPLAIQGRRIGLCWASGQKLNPAFARREYKKRSLANTDLELLIRSLESTGVELVSLQVSEADHLPLHLSPLVQEPLTLKSDFLDTAQQILSCGLVITVDTAVAHLVGAMGHPGLLLLPCGADGRWGWRQNKSVWYPSLTLMRQRDWRSWRSPIEAVVEQVRHLIALQAIPSGSVDPEGDSL